MKGYLTVDEAASFLNVTRQTISRVLRRGELPVYTTALDRRQKLLKRSEVEALGLPRPAGRPARTTTAVAR